MSSFAEADRIVEAVARGATLREACTSTGISYSTARFWTAEGRRSPKSRYATWLARLDAARGRSTPAEQSDTLSDGELGPVERSVASILDGRDLKGEEALVGEQARSLARAVDELGGTAGGASKTALVAASRRLEELISKLALPRQDRTDEIRERRFRRLDDIVEENARHLGLGDGKPSAPVAATAARPAATDNGHAVTDVPIAPGKRRQW